MELFTPGHLIVLAVVAALVFFGRNQLPDMARSLGRSLRVFKTEITELTTDASKPAELPSASDGSATTSAASPIRRPSPMRSESTERSTRKAG